MAEKERLLTSFTPKFDSERQRMDRLLMSSDERAAEVNALQVMLLRLEISDLADVVTAE